VHDLGGDARSASAAADRRGDANKGRTSSRRVRPAGASLGGGGECGPDLRHVSHGRGCIDHRWRRYYHWRCDVMRRREGRADAQPDRCAGGHSYANTQTGVTPPTTMPTAVPSTMPSTVPTASVGIGRRRRQQTQDCGKGNENTCLTDHANLGIIDEPLSVIVVMTNRRHNAPGHRRCKDA
jgi:hypothetical protein